MSISQSDIESRIQTVIESLKTALTRDSAATWLDHSSLSIGLSPHEIYALVSFLRHERRQEWVRYVVESRLQVNGVELAQSGAFAHPENTTQSDDVPGEDGWRYFFHGRGCCFSHEDGTSVDVDFADDGTALDIDPYFYTSFLDSSSSLGFCEAQLKQPKGLENGWQVVLPRLGQAGLIQKEWRFRLSEAGRTTASALEPLVEFIEAHSGAPRCVALAFIGDFVSAEAEAVCVGLNSSAFSTAAKRQLSDRVTELQAVIRSNDKSVARFALVSLAALGKDHALHDVIYALRRKPAGGMNHDALAALRLWEGDDVTGALVEAFQLFTRQSFSERLLQMVSPAAAPSQNERAINRIITGIAAALFFKLKPQALITEAGADLNRALRRDCKACDDAAGFFLYLLDEIAGLAKLKANLSNLVPITRQGAACFLALIGTRASEQILIHVVRGPVNNGGHEAACALSLIESETAQSAALEWLRRNDGFENVEGKEYDFNGRKVRTLSMDEMMRSNLREQLRYDFEKKCSEFAPLLQLWRSQPT